MEQKQNRSSAVPPAEIAALLDFAPVPVRARKDGWTPERQRLYVAALAETGHGGKAAAVVEMTPQSACRLRRRPGAAGFARACEAAWGCARRRWAAARLGPGKGSAFLMAREAETNETYEPSAPAPSRLPDRLRVLAGALALPPVASSPRRPEP